MISGRTRARLASTAAVLCMSAGAASADQVFVDNVIVDGSLCVGVDCANGENFGFDTLRLKENNLRLHFDDTSSSGSFAKNDWRITINESDNGGAEKFSIDDATGGTSPFHIEAGAPNNTMRIAADGRVGVGTANPVLPMHLVDGNSPGLRIEQDGSAGFTAQSWDLAGNETNFFLRNVTNGSRLPFRVFPTAADDLMVLRNARVGVNVENPGVALDVRSTEGLGAINVTDTGGSGPLRMLDLENDGAVQLFMNNTTKTDAQWLFSAGRSMLLSPTSDAADQVFELSNTGNLTIGGTLTQSSDKNRKTAIEPVDPDAILAKVATMPVAEWTYIHDAEAGIRHIGPMAQDFHAAFGTGADETGISALDGTGVALASIQALAAENAALRARLDALEAAD